ncbi:uncharacterized protein LY89DRAFT_736822 [Mollisia scopiformis]|uniref:Uncharacterized protein n=1 Tax=Mollisia scopiformis TaxID=149040 RepID=A0A194X0W2_MOLSC|nr:uncharacterized protein LY89DRAFT_736822 [Mollisia scopiformis]KUJ13825.1 hypothetical protein LY89DRAFT_736822 [Mollisia scopiformis]
MENMTFQEFCDTELRTMAFPSADEALRMNLDSYEALISRKPELLRDFQYLREQYTTAVPDLAELPAASLGVAVGSYNHLDTFIEACRRDEKLLALIHENMFNDVVAYKWAAGLEIEERDAPPQWLRNSFERSVEVQAEKIRRWMYGQPHRDESHVAFTAGIRSRIYQLVDESENYQWSDGNRIPDELLPLVPLLSRDIALNILPSVNWVEPELAAAVTLLREAKSAGLREQLPFQPMDFFDDTPHRDYIVLGNLIVDTRYHSPQSERPMESLESLFEPATRHDAESIIDPEFDDSTESEFSTVDDDYQSESQEEDIHETALEDWIEFLASAPTPHSNDPDPPRQVILDHYWDVANHENTPEAIRAVLIDLADQSESEDEDSHVRVREDWFERGNILEDRRPQYLGPARHPWDTDSEDEDENDNRSYFENDSDSDALEF